MVLLLFAVFLGSVFAFQTTGSMETMAAENNLMAVDLQNAACASSLFVPLVLAIAIALFIGAIITMSQSFGSAYDAGGTNEN